MYKLHVCLILFSVVGSAAVFAQPTGTGSGPAVPSISVIKENKDTKSAPASFENKLPADAEDALLHATQGMFYSIDPESIDYSAKEQVTNDDRFHGYKILGKMNLVSPQLEVVTKEFLSEVNGWNSTMGMSLCMITPRHALRLTVKDQVYDYLLCYQCGLYVVFKDGEIERSGSVARGSPKLLNDILTAAHIPLPRQSP